MRMLWLFVGLALVAAVLALGAACGDDEDSTENAVLQLCNDLDELEASLQDLQEIDADTTVDEAEASREAVDTALEDVRTSAREVPDAAVNDVEDAYQELADAITGVQGEDTLGDAAVSIDAAVAGVTQAKAEVYASLSCQ